MWTRVLARAHTVSVHTRAHGYRGASSPNDDGNESSVVCARVHVLADVAVAAVVVVECARFFYTLLQCNICTVCTGFVWVVMYM